MADRFSVELWYQIIGWADNNTLTNIARTSKSWKLVAYEVLYRELTSPWPLIRLLEPAKYDATIINASEALNPRDGFAITLPIHGDKIARFREIATLVRRIEWTEDARQMCSGCGAIASENIDQEIAQRQDLLLYLSSLRASCLTSHGVKTFMPWLSRSLVNLDVAFGPDINDSSIISCLLHIRGLCTALTSFTLTLDSSKYSRPRDGVIDTLEIAILAMQHLTKLSLPLELITRPVAGALAQLPFLDTLVFTAAMFSVADHSPPILFTTPILFNTNNNDDAMSELDLDLDFDYISVPDTFNTMPSIATSRFFAQHNARDTGPDDYLVESLPAQQDPQERAEALGNIAAGCIKAVDANSVKIQFNL